MVPVDGANQRDAQNATRLHVQVKANRLENVRKLLQRRPDLSVTDDKNNTPLHIAAECRNAHVMRILLEYSEPKTVKRCIDFVNNDGETALHIAARKNCLINVRLLLENGCCFEVRTTDGKRAIEVTTEPKIKELLVNVELDSRFAASGKYSQLEARIKNYSQQDFAATAYARNKDGRTSLQRAICNFHANTVITIVNARIKKLPSDTEKKYTEIELIWAAKKISNNQPLLVMLSLSPQNFEVEFIGREIIQILDAAKNIIDIVNDKWMPDDKRSVLLAIVQEGVEALESCTVDGNVTCRDNVTRYYETLKNEDKIIAFAVTLLICIIKTIAVFARDIFGAQLLIATKCQNIELFRCCIEEQKIDVNVTDAERKTCLHYAADQGNEVMVEMLLKKGANTKLKEQQNERTALHMAAYKGYNEIVKTILEGESSTDLIDMKTREEGWTALHFAAKAGHQSTVLLLWQHGAAYDVPGHVGELPHSLTKNLFMLALFAVPDELFALAERGDHMLLHYLIHMQQNELMAVGSVRSSKGKTLQETADANGHKIIAEEVSKIVKNNAPTEKENAPELLDTNKAYNKLLQRVAMSLRRFKT